MCVRSAAPDSETPCAVACQALLSTGSSRQEYWGGLPFSSPGELTDPGIKAQALVSPALAGRFFTTSTTWEVRRYEIGPLHHTLDCDLACSRTFVQAISLSLVLVAVLTPLLVFPSLLPSFPSIPGLLPADVSNSWAPGPELGWTFLPIVMLKILTALGSWLLRSC